MIDRVVEQIAEMMMGHFTNPIESPNEFFFDEDLADWISDNISGDGMGEENKAFRQAVFERLKVKLEL